MAERWSAEVEELLAGKLSTWVGGSNAAAKAPILLGLLADAGVLVPPDAPTRTEWASEHLGDLGQAGNRLFQPTGSSRASDTGERLARIRVETWRADRPDVTTRLLRRTATTVYGEWEEVSD